MGLRLLSCCLGHSLPLKDSQLSFSWGKSICHFLGKLSLKICLSSLHIIALFL